MKRILDKEDKLAYKERHWTKKELSEMTDRDWRIFKEDFSITAKGKYKFGNLLCNTLMNVRTQSLKIFLRLNKGNFGRIS